MVPWQALCVPISVMGSVVTQSDTREQSAPLPAVSGHSENSLTTPWPLWFERSDEPAIRSGKFGEAQLCFDISHWFQMPKHGESKPTKIGELQHNCCQGKSKAWGLQAQFFLTAYHDVYSCGCWRGNGTRIPFLVCTQWMAHQEPCLLLLWGPESIMPKRDGRCRTMSSSLSSRSSGDRWAGLKSFSSLNEQASSQLLCPPATWHLWLNLWMFDMLRTNQQESYSLILPKKTKSPLSSRHHIVSSASLLECQPWSFFWSGA